MKRCVLGPLAYFPLRFGSPFLFASFPLSAIPYPFNQTFFVPFFPFSLPLTCMHFPFLIQITNLVGNRR
ncbi:hypothetical protein KSS87_023013 [Heliosperma pusillum]|nr:hypothetical protein KSS87_023013 [Heliosperma pusillum]